jgi:membrane associated rhomboid family serine protease
MFGQLFRNMPEVVKNLLIINVLFFIAQNIIPEINIHLSLFPIISEQFKPWQLATHFFMHANLGHIFFNMFALVIFGSQLEKIWGPKRFLIYYFLCAIGAAILHQIVSTIEIKSMISLLPESDWTVMKNNGNEIIDDYFKNYINYNNKFNLFFTEDLYKTYLIYNTPMIGASGAVFGLLAAFGYLFPNTKLMLLFPPIPIKAKFFVIGYAALELYLGMANNPGDNVAHFAHLGGAIIGFIMVLYWNKNRNSFF